MITQKTIDEVLTLAKIEEVVEDYVNLRRRGVNMIGLCPFHDEKTPSFTVSPSKNIFKCFGCGKGGDAISFVKEHEGFSYPEAIRYLARKYNIEIEEKEFSPEEKETIELRDSLYIVNEFAKDYYQNQLFNTDEGKSVGLSYFKKRGFREATIKKFNLGYAPSSRDSLTQAATMKQHKLEHLQAVGLTTKTSRDFFWDRVMFSIHNLSGKVIALAGRTLSTDKKVPKYINSPESDIYNKRKTLYALYFAKNEIRKQDECILVEGYTDVISLHQAGISNVVASSGTSLTKEQIHLVKRYTPNIKVIYDGDTAGIKAALRGMDLILEQDMNVRLVLLPEGEDPDSFLQQSGTEKFKQFLEENAKDFVLFKSELLLKEAGNDPLKKAGVVKDIVQSIALIPDTLKRSVYIQHCSQLIDISEQILTVEVNKSIKGNFKKKSLEKERNRAKVNEDAFVSHKTEKDHSQKPVKTENYREKEIIRILLTLGEKQYDEEKKISVAEYLMMNLEAVLDSFENPLYQTIIDETRALIKDGKPFNTKHFLQHKQETIRSMTVDFLAFPFDYASWEEKGVILQTQKAPEENFVRDSYQAILRFKLDKINLLLKEVKVKIKELSEIDKTSEEYIYTIKALQQLLGERNSIAKELNTVVLGR